MIIFTMYRNDPKFSDRYAWANSADPDQSLIRVYTVCHSVWTVWTHYSMVEPHSSNFRVITTNVLGVQIFRKFTVSPFTTLPLCIPNEIIKGPFNECTSSKYFASCFARYTQNIHNEQKQCRKNKIHFSDIHRSMNAIGLVQSKWCLRVSLTLQETHCINVEGTTYFAWRRGICCCTKIGSSKEVAGECKYWSLNYFAENT